MSNGGGVYVQWRWRICPMGVAYMSNGGGVYVQWGWRICPMGVAYMSNGGGVYVQWGGVYVKWGWRIHPKVSNPSSPDDTFRAGLRKLGPKNNIPEVFLTRKAKNIHRCKSGV